MTEIDASLANRTNDNLAAAAQFVQLTWPVWTTAAAIFVLGRLSKR